MPNRSAANGLVSAVLVVAAFCCASGGLVDVVFADAEPLALDGRDGNLQRVSDVQAGAEVAKEDVGGPPRRTQPTPARVDRRPARRTWLLLGLLGASALVLFFTSRQQPDTGGHVTIDLPAGPVEVARKPIADGSSSHCDTRLVQPRPDLVLVTRPNQYAIGCGGVALLVVCVCVFLLIQFFPHGKVWFVHWVLYGLGAAAGTLVAVFAGLVVIGSLFDARRFRFDRGGQEVRIGLPGSREMRSFDDLRALQLCRHDQYSELNLVLGGDQPGQRNVSCHGDLLWTWQVARLLGRFLDLPLIDQYTDPKQLRVLEPHEFDGLPPEQRTAEWLMSHVPAESLNTSSASSRNRALYQRDADHLVIARSQSWDQLVLVFFAILFGTAFGLGVAYFFMGNWIDADPGRFWIGSLIASGGSLFVLVYCWRASRWRVTFDRLTERIVYGPGWDRQQRPLEEVVAVQIISGPWLDGESTWQVNLVFDDPPLPRYNISCHADGMWTRATGEILAEFLDVPLLDVTEDG